MFLLGGICLDLLCPAGHMDPLERAALETGGPVHYFCDCLRVYYRESLSISGWAGMYGTIRDLPFQLMGQICLPFIIIFSGLCAAGIVLSGYTLCFIYGEERPEFHVI